MVELSDVVASETPMRKSPAEISVFKSHGIGLWDIAAADAIYQTAIARSVGVRLPIEQAVVRETPARAAISSSFIILALFELQGPRRFQVGAPKSVRGIISLKSTLSRILNNWLKRFSLSVSETIQLVSRR